MKFWQSQLIGTKFTLIDVVFQGDTTHFYWTTLQYQKKGISLDEVQRLDSFEVLCSVISRKLPVFLNGNGEGVSVKKINDPKNYLSSILFNANPEDFYISEQFLETQLWVGLCRKTRVNDLLETFSKAGYSILGMNIGPMALFRLLAFKPDVLASDFHRFELNSASQIEAIVPTTTFNGTLKIHIQKEVVPTNVIGSFGVALGFFTQQKSDLAPTHFEAISKEFTYKRIFEKFGVIVLVGFLISLLVSFVAIDYYAKAYQEVSYEKQLYARQYQKMLALEKDKANKKAILVNSGLNETNFLSYYAHELIASVPESVSLKELSIFPVTQKITKGEAFSIDNNHILITGNALDNTGFSKWVLALQNKKWTDKVEIISMESEENRSSFKLKIALYHAL